MIGLPTATRSSTSSRSTPASLREPPDQLVDRRLHGVGQLRPPLRVHHHVRDPAHQVLAEADLRVHRPGGRQHLARAELAQVAGDRRRPDVDRDAVGDVDEARPDRDQVVAAMHGDRDGVPAGGQGGLEVDEHPRVDREAVERPLRGERVEQQAQVAAAFAQRGRVDLDVVEAHDRVDDEAGQVHGLADDRAVDLALGGDVDDDVPEDVRRAAQPRARDQRPAAVVVPLRRAGGGEVVGRRGDGVLGERAERRLHLAPAADAPAAAHRVQVDTAARGPRRARSCRCARPRAARTARRRRRRCRPAGRSRSRPAALAVPGHGGSASLPAATGSQPPEAISVRSRSVGNAASSRAASARAAASGSPVIGNDRRRHSATCSWAVFLPATFVARSTAFWKRSGQQHLVALLAGAGVDLGRDVAPGDDDHLGSVPGHQDQERAERRAATRVLAVSAATAASRQ